MDAMDGQAVATAVLSALGKQRNVEYESVEFLPRAVEAVGIVKTIIGRASGG